MCGNEDGNRSYIEILTDMEFVIGLMFTSLADILQMQTTQYTTFTDFDNGIPERVRKLCANWRRRIETTSRSSFASIARLVPVMEATIWPALEDKEDKMKALAYRNYVPEQGGYLCSACVERDQKQFDYPHLFFRTTMPEKVDEKVRCAWCGYWVGGHDAKCAAERIAAMLDRRFGRREKNKRIHRPRKRGPNRTGNNGG